jgi:hypothetical protein
VRRFYRRTPHRRRLLQQQRVLASSGLAQQSGQVVASLAKLGLLSAYHELRNEQQGGETVPSLYWRDHTKDGPSYHIDYVFLPAHLLAHVESWPSATMRIGAAAASATSSFERTPCVAHGVA